MDDYAKVDNMLSASQTDIGESSNLAQIGQSYACSFSDPRFDDYVAILSVVAQASIDSCKKRFDIDIPVEIKRIKKELNIKGNGYPSFWTLIKRGFNRENINPLIHCPMNYLYKLKFKEVKPAQSTLSMEHFFKKYELSVDRRTSKRVEELISKYSFNLYNYNTNVTDDWLLIRSDFDELIRDIQQIHISKNYLGFMSWIIDRNFVITPAMKRNRKNIKSTVRKNKSLLMSVLYHVNKNVLFKVLSANMDE